MADYTRINLKSDVEDMAPKHGMEGIELGEWDALRVPAGVWRGMEAGPDGAEIVAFGAPSTDNKDAEMEPGWWPEGG